MDLELFVDAADVERDGVDRDAEFHRRHFVVVAFDQQFQDTFFVRRREVSDIRLRHA